MNKKIQSIIDQYGLVEEKKNQAYGNIKGYETNLFYDAFDTVSPLKIHISCHADDSKKQAIINTLNSEKIKFFKVDATAYGIIIGLNDLTINKLIKRFPSIVDLVYGTLEKNGALGASNCPVSGEELTEENKKVSTIDRAKITLTTASVDMINEKITKENEEFDKRPNNILFGFAGAFLGALVGIILFVIIFFIGYVSAWTSVLSAVLGAFLYQKFGGKTDKKMIVIVCLTTIIMFLLTIFILYILAANGLAIDDSLKISGMEAFNYYMKNNSEFAREFITNIVLTLVFTIIGIGIVFSYLMKKIKRTDKIK